MNRRHTKIAYLLTAPEPIPGRKTERMVKGLVGLWIRFMQRHRSIRDTDGVGVRSCCVPGSLQRQLPQCRRCKAYVERSSSPHSGIPTTIATPLLRHYCAHILNTYREQMHIIHYSYQVAHCQKSEEIVSLVLTYTNLASILVIRKHRSIHRVFFKQIYF